MRVASWWLGFGADGEAGRSSVAFGLCLPLEIGSREELVAQALCFGLAVAVRRRCSSLARIDGEVSNCHGYAMFAYIVRVVSTPGAKIP